MYNRPYNYYPTDSMYYTSDHSYMQPPNPYPHGNGNPYFQTPFEQFAKPPQPEDWSYPMQQPDYPQQVNSPQQMNSSQQMNPHQQMNLPQNNVTGYFQNENGQLDFDKMLSTVGQLANTYHQVSPIVKQVGALIKTFRT